MSDAPRLPENPELLRRAAIGAYFGSIATAHPAGPIGELVQMLATGILDPMALDAYVKRHGLAREDWYRRQVTDLGLGFIAHRLASGELTESVLAEIHALNAHLGLDRGAYYTLRPAEVAAILGEQMDRILEDAVVTGEEELLQVELQAAFALGYDQYLSLIRGVLERVHAQLVQTAKSSGPNAKRAAHNLEQLESFYRLATMRGRRPGALY